MVVPSALYLPPRHRRASHNTQNAGVYFGTFFAFALHLNAGDTTCVLAYATAWVVFPLWSLLNGWPRPRAYGAKDHLSRREIVSTAPSRLLQVAAAAAT